MKVSYDPGADVLYIAFVDTPNAVTSVETDNGDVLRLEKETGDVVGITILFFEERTTHGRGVDIPQLDVLHAKASSLHSQLQHVS